MAKRHWTDEQLIGRLYGLDADDSHLRDCDECAVRWQKAVSARTRVTEAPELSAERLEEQRRQIFRRMEERAPHLGSFELAHGLAMAMVLLLFGVLLLGPKPKPEPSLASSDNQFFSEVYSVAQSTEPRAFAPVRGLFEDEQ